MKGSPSFAQNTQGSLQNLTTDAGSNNHAMFRSGNLPQGFLSPNASPIKGFMKDSTRNDQSMLSGGFASVKSAIHGRKQSMPHNLTTKGSGFGQVMSPREVVMKARQTLNETSSFHSSIRGGLNNRGSGFNSVSRNMAGTGNLRNTYNSPGEKGLTLAPLEIIGHQND